MFSCSRLLVLAVLCLSWVGPLAAQAPTLRELLPKVPPEANALVLIDVQALHRSPLAQREKWVARHEAEFMTGKIPFPPTTALVLLTSHSSLEGAPRGGQLGLVSLTRTVPVEKIAEFEQGILETVAGQKVVLTPRRLYIAPLSPRLVAVQAPAERQELARWLQFAQRSRTPVLSPWLQDAAGQLNQAAPMMMALHLEDAIDPRRIRQRLEQAQPPLPAGTNFEALAEALASVKGMRFAFQVKETIQVELRIEFNKPVKAYAPLLQPILARGVETLCEGVPSLNEWQMEVQDQVVLFRTPLTSEAFHKLLATLQPHGAPAGIVAREQDMSGDKAFVSRRYFQQVTALADELEKTAARTNDYNRGAQMYEDYAQRIDGVPIYGVDEELVSFAQGVSGKLRTIAQSLRGVPITAAVLESAKKEIFLYQPPSYVANYNFWQRRMRPPIYGGIGVGTVIPEQAFYDSNLPQLRAQLAQAIAKDTQSRHALWRTIGEDTTRIRQKMTRKFGVEF